MGLFGLGRRKTKTAFRVNDLDAGETPAAADARPLNRLSPPKPRSPPPSRPLRLRRRRRTKHFAC